MKQLIKHILKENLGQVLSKSLVNCHVKGLHSVVFTEKPLIRLFITDTNHEIWKNRPNFQDLSVAIHGHHCNLTLECIYGSFINYKFNCKHKKDNVSYILTQKWLYSSKITGNSSGFELIGKELIEEEPIVNKISNGQFIYLDSAELHTIWVQKGQKCAWFVYEGQEDVNYESICYSNTDLTSFDSSELYKPMEKDFLMYLLKSVNLYA